MKQPKIFVLIIVSAITLLVGGGVYWRMEVSPWLIVAVVCGVAVGSLFLTAFLAIEAGVSLPFSTSGRLKYAGLIAGGIVVAHIPYYVIPYRESGVYLFVLPLVVLAGILAKSTVDVLEDL